MGLQLAYRMLSSRQLMAPPPSSWDFPPPPGLEASAIRALNDRFNRELPVIRESVKVDLSNVCAYYASSGKMDWSLTGDIPNWAPPWPSFWAEWEEPEEWLMRGGVERRPLRNQLGWLAVALETSGMPEGDFAGWRKTLGDFAGSQPLEELDDSRLGSYLPRSRWVVCCDAFVSTGAPPVNGRAMWAGVCAFLFVAPDGRLVETVAAGPRIVSLERSGDVDQIYAGLHVLGLGLSFMHCKNVTRREAAADRGDKFHGRGRRGPQVPVLRFTTLEINPMREVLRREGREAEVGAQRALHICRGHFAHYTDERPLFGRAGASGRFWIPDHARGSAEAGGVVKDYRVSPGEG